MVDPMCRSCNKDPSYLCYQDPAYLCYINIRHKYNCISKSKTLSWFIKKKKKKKKVPHLDPKLLCACQGPSGAITSKNVAEIGYSFFLFLF